MTGVTNLSLLDSDTAAVKFDFLLPQSHPNRSYHRMKNLGNSGGKGSNFNFGGLLFNSSNSSEDCRRHGVMSAFASFEEFKVNFSELVELLYHSPPISPSLLAAGSSFESFNFGSRLGVGSPPNSFDDRIGGGGRKTRKTNYSLTR